jgi:hypothetical protein
MFRILLFHFGDYSCFLSCECCFVFLIPVLMLCWPIAFWAWVAYVTEIVKLCGVLDRPVRAYGILIPWHQVPGYQRAAILFWYLLHVSILPLVSFHLPSSNLFSFLFHTVSPFSMFLLLFIFIFHSFNPLSVILKLPLLYLHHITSKAILRLKTTVRNKYYSCLILLCTTEIYRTNRPQFQNTIQRTHTSNTFKQNNIKIRTTHPRYGTRIRYYREYT